MPYPSHNHLIREKEESFNDRRHLNIHFWRFMNEHRLCGRNTVISNYLKHQPCCKGTHSQYITTGYRLNGRRIGSSIPSWCKKTFCSPQRPDRLWSPPSLIWNEYQYLFLWGRAVVVEASSCSVNCI
jgi:hypothetical protein